MTEPYETGGIAAPDFELYYMVAQAQFAKHWYDEADNSPHTWIEEYITIPTDVRSVIFDTRHKDSCDFDPVSCTVKVWGAIYKKLKIEIPYNPEIPLWKYPNIPPTFDTNIQEAWDPATVMKVGDLYIDGKFVTLAVFTKGIGGGPLRTLQYY